MFNKKIFFIILSLSIGTILVLLSYTRDSELNEKECINILKNYDPEIMKMTFSEYNCPIHIFPFLENIGLSKIKIGQSGNIVLNSSMIPNIPSHEKMVYLIQSEEGFEGCMSLNSLKETDKYIFNKSLVCNEFSIYIDQYSNKKYYFIGYEIVFNDIPGNNVIRKITITNNKIVSVNMVNKFINNWLMENECK